MKCCFSFTASLCFAGLTASSDPKVLALKPAISRSASQRLLVTSKPVPPIQNSLPPLQSGWMSNGEQFREDGTDHGGNEDNHKELTSEVRKQDKSHVVDLQCTPVGRALRSSFPHGVSTGWQLSQGRAQVDVLSISGCLCSALCVPSVYE